MSSVIFRSTNPNDWLQVDGVYISEQTPPGRVIGKGTGIVGLVGQFERGPVNEIVAVGSTKQLVDTFGGFGGIAGPVAGYPGYLALLNKPFSSLRIVRVAPTGLTLATKNLLDSIAGIAVRVDANSKGVWGNEVSIEVAAPSDAAAGDFDLVVRYRGAVERHRNRKLTALPAAGASAYVTFTKVGAAVPIVAAAAALAAGADGTAADADYTDSGGSQIGVRLFEAENDDTNILLADRHTAAVNNALLQHVELTKNKTAIISGVLGQTVAAAITDVSSYRSDRIIYAPYGKTYVAEAGGVVTLAGDSFIASSAQRLDVIEDIAGESKAGHYAGLVGLEWENLTRDEYIRLEHAGIASFIRDADVGYFVRSGVNTSLDSALNMVFRRRATDYIQESIAQRLKFFGNKVNKRLHHLAMKAEVENFLTRMQIDGRLPTAEDLKGRNFQGQPLMPFLVDIDSGNTQDSLAGGLFKMILKVTLYSSMRYIVLETIIGQGVVVVKEIEARLAA